MLDLNKKRFWQKVAIGHPKHIHEALTHEDPNIRNIMVYKDKGEHHDILKHDASPIIRKNVAFHSKDKKILEHLHNDPDEQVSSTAWRSLGWLNKGKTNGKE
jgi:hypothetical protein